MMDEDIRLLTQISLFSTLPFHELELLAKNLRLCQFKAGELLIREAEQGDIFYILRQGQIEIIKALGTPEESVLGVRGPGEFVGELSLLNREGIRMASVRALTPVLLWEMTRQDFDALLKRQPMLSYEMVRVLSARLTAAHAVAIQDLQGKNHQLTQAYEELKAAQAQIIEKEKLERELQLAHEIQMAILPAALPEVAGFDFGACLLPARSVGGDFYEFVRLDEHRLGIMIGDVTDKGVPAAIFMAQVHAFLVAEAVHNPSPGDVLREVNQHLMAMTDSGLFVTVLYGVLDCRSGEFCYARAGHELPVLVGEEGCRVCKALNPGQPLGLFDEPLLDEQTLTLTPGALLLLYTDGVNDERDPGGEVFGLKRLLALLQATSQPEAQALVDHLLETVLAHLDDAPQDDDITLLAVRAN
jgi:serine phosphatase RsbU (regulator of sigma subunit)